MSGYLLPAVTNVWRAEQQALIDSLGGCPLRLAGDVRCDSLGYSALCGTHPLLETGVNRFIHLELIKSTGVKPSSQVELEGLVRSLTYFAELDLTVEGRATDRHLQDVHCSAAL